MGSTHYTATSWPAYRKHPSFPMEIGEEDYQSYPGYMTQSEASQRRSGICSLEYQ